mgnify:CR=1 FL=1
MQKLIIKGKKSLSGVVEISGSKNATLPILAASILNNQKIEINNVPIVKDVMTMIELLKHIHFNSLRFCCPFKKQIKSYISLPLGFPIST